MMNTKISRKMTLAMVPDQKRLIRYTRKQLMTPAMEDVIVSQGLVWNAGTSSGNQNGEYTGRDPVTGEVKKQFFPDVPDGTYWFHHRCYMAKATEAKNQHDFDVTRPRLDAGAAHWLADALAVTLPGHRWMLAL